jgi:hypothetical protein
MWRRRSSTIGLACILWATGARGVVRADSPAVDPLHIPEPMMFDLIRPLGASRGELEVNSLFRMGSATRPRTLLWAPEIEFAFVNGHAVEIELPMEGSRVDSWKGAVQGTFRGGGSRRVAQGWQVLREAERDARLTRLDVMHLAGSRWHPRWSAFAMTGIERQRSGARTSLGLLGNYSVFFHPPSKVSYGLESNFNLRGLAGSSVLLMPQGEIRGRRWTLQAGAGWRRAHDTRGLHAGWRLSRTFTRPMSTAPAQSRSAHP